MSKVENIGYAWRPEAAIASVADLLKGNNDAEVLILFRESKDHIVNFRAANLTFATANFMADEYKHSITNKCYECKCQSREEDV